MKFFPENLAQHVCGKGLKCLSKVGAQYLVNQGLIPLARLVRLRLEAFDNFIVQINGYARFARLRQNWPTLSF